MSNKRVENQGATSVNSNDVQNQLGGKMNDTAKMQILQANDNLIEDLNKDLSQQQKEYTDTVKFRLSAESGIEAMNRDLAKLKQRIQNQQKIVESKRQDPKKVAQIQQLQIQNKDTGDKVKAVQEEGAPNRARLLDERAKNVKLSNLNHDLNEKWQKHLDDEEEKASLESKIGAAKESIDALHANIEKLKRIRDKYANNDFEGEMFRINELQKNVGVNNHLARHTIMLDEESLATGKLLKNLLKECENLLVRNNIISDKLPITLGIHKDEYHQTIINQYMKQESFLVDDEQVEFSKASVAYFFRIFIVEVKVNNVTQQVNEVVADYEQTRDKFKKNHELMANLKVEDLTLEIIEAAHRFNDDVRAKNAQYRAKVKEFTEVLQVQKIGVDRFQERIRNQAVHQVKERQKTSDILAKNGINRVGKNSGTLKEFFVEVERLLKVTWLQHHINDFTDFKKKVLGLNEENNALTGNFHVIKLALEKAKLKQQGIEQQDINKLQKLINCMNTFLDSTYADHEKLVDVEKRIKELTLEYNALIEKVCEDTKEILKNKFVQKVVQQQDLRRQDEDLINFLDKKKSDLYNIKSNVDDNDKAIQDKFLVYETQLAEANQDEDFANENTRQIQSKIDKSQKSFLRMIPIKIQDISTCDNIVESINKLDLHIKMTEQIISDAYKKVKDFDGDFKKIEDQIRNKRIKDAENSLGVAFGSLEKMNKILERLRADVAKVQKDQKDLINNKFEDQEKQRDTFQFAREIDSKIDMLNEYVQKRDNFKSTLDALKADYENKLKARETPTGLEFKKIQQDSDRVNTSILTQISVLEGPVTEEINSLKETNKTLQDKYKYKQQKHNDCTKLRNTKTGEFKTWLERLKDFEGRQDTLEKALKDIGYTPEYAKLYVSLVNRVAKNKSITLDFDNQVQNNQKILIVEATDLDYLPLKIVKSQRLDEIYKLLEQMRVSFQGFDDLLNDIEKELKQLEKDVADFMNKLRGSQYNDVFNKMRKLENNLEKLNKKIKETKEEMDDFKQELSGNQVDFKNKDNIKQRLNDLASELERIVVERDEVVRKLDILKGRFNKLDKQNLSVQDCEAIMNESDQLDHTCNLEYNNTVTVQEKLRELVLEYREASKGELERQKLIQNAKDGIKKNRENLKKLKQQLQDILDKANDFEVLYLAEQASEDYAYRKDEVEKDLNDIRQIKEDTLKYLKTVDQLMNSLSDFTDSQIEQIQDQDQLKGIIEKNEKIASEIRNLSKIVDGIARDLELRRERTQDAEIRKNCAKHLAELDKIGEKLEKQVEMLDKFEESVLGAISDEQESNKGKQLPPQLAALQDTLNQVKKQMNDFKVKYNACKADMQSLNKEIKDKDLEKTEPLPKMAEYIERMNRVANSIKDLKNEVDEIAKKIEQNAGLLGSMGIDKQLQRLLDLLVKAQKIKDTLDAIQRIIDLTDSYNGYTSDDEDTGFFTNMNSDSKELKEELLKELQNFQNLEKQIRQVIEELEFVKQNNGGAVDQATQDKINKTVDQIKGLYRKGTSNKDEIDATAINNKGKTSDHTLEGKIQRRKNELEHIDGVLNGNLEQIQALKEKIDDEVALCGSDGTYQKYVNDLKQKADEIEKLTVPINTASKNYKNIAFDNDQLQQEVEKVNSEPEIKVDKRLDYFDSHLIIKKRLNHVKDQNPYDQFGRKINQLEEEVAQIMSKKPKKAAYKFVKGDEVDQLLADILNKSGESIDIKRLGGGFYMVGDKKIYCKIMNGKLVVRVGGGYVSIEEFIKIYLKKLLRNKTGDEIQVELEQDDTTPKTGKAKGKTNDGFQDNKPKGVVGIGSIKDKLK